MEGYRHRSGDEHHRTVRATHLQRALQLADDADAAAAEYRSLADDFLAATAGLDEPTCAALYYGIDLALYGSVLLHAAWSLAEATGAPPEPLRPDERLELRCRFDWEPVSER